MQLRRCYYHCAECRHGLTPWDAELQLDQTAALTPAAREVTCLTGVQSSFAQASERMLTILCGLRLSESTVERTTEAAGEQVSAHLQARQTFGDKRAWQWHREAHDRNSTR